MPVATIRGRVSRCSVPQYRAASSGFSQRYTVKVAENLVFQYLHVMFAVDSIDETLDRLRKRGAQTRRRSSQYQDSYRLCYIRGPEGLLIGIVFTTNDACSFRSSRAKEKISVAINHEQRKVTGCEDCLTLHRLVL